MPLIIQRKINRKCGEIESRHLVLDLVGLMHRNIVLVTVRLPSGLVAGSSEEAGI
jgi:hypothetical protein